MDARCPSGLRPGHEILGIPRDAVVDGVIRRWDRFKETHQQKFEMANSIIEAQEDYTHALKNLPPWKRFIFLPHFSTECHVLTQKYKISASPDGQLFLMQDINRYFDGIQK